MAPEELQLELGFESDEKIDQENAFKAYEDLEIKHADLVNENFVLR